MKQFIRQTLIASTLTVVGAAATATGAFAQAAPATDATVNFQGTVGSVCTFSNINDGTLAYDGFSVLRADQFEGMRGQVSLDCTGPSEISVSLPQNNGSTTDLLPSAANYMATVEAPSIFNSTSNEQGVGPSAPIQFFGPVNDELLEVGMMIETIGSTPAGAYNYDVILTATPQ